MPKTRISEYSTTNTDNSDIESINIAEGCAPSGINNAIRELMVHLKEFQTGASGDAFTFAGGVLISGSLNTATGTMVMTGANTVALAAGAVGTPSLYANGDTNTGIFFPTADTIAFAEGGAEAMRIDSDGDVGIGTNAPGSKLDVKGTLRLSGSTSGYVGIAPAAAAGSTTYTLPSADGTSGQVLSTNGSGTLSWATSGGGSSISAGDSKVEVTDTGSNGTIVFNTDNSERMRINSSGNVGIGVTSPQIQEWRTGTYLTVGAGSTRGEIEIDCSASDSSVQSYGALLWTFSTNTTNHKTVAAIESSAEGATANQRGGILKFYTKANATTSPTEKMRIDSVGNTTFQNNLSVGGATPTTSGTGITFPATQSASTDANTLDDYEEGTWTPSVGGNATYTAQQGNYVKVGRIVFIQCYITINALGTGSASTISGLPFTSQSISTSYGMTCTYFASLAINSLYVAPVVISNNTTVSFNTNNTSGATFSSADAAILGANTRIDFTGCYLANA